MALELLNITATLRNGKTITLNNPDDIDTIAAQRGCLFFFDNGQVFHGFTDGEVDEDGDFCLTSGNEVKGMKGLALPFGRLLGWAYIQGELFPEL